MSITIPIYPDLDAALRSRRVAAGLTIEQLATQLLEREAGTASEHHSRLRAVLGTVNQLKGKLSPVSDKALDLETLYGAG